MGQCGISESVNSKVIEVVPNTSCREAFRCGNPTEGHKGLKSRNTTWEKVFSLKGGKSSQKSLLGVGGHKGS